VSCVGLNRQSSSQPQRLTVRATLNGRTRFRAKRIQTAAHIRASVTLGHQANFGGLRELGTSRAS